MTPTEYHQRMTGMIGDRSDLFRSLLAVAAQLKEHPAISRVDVELRETDTPHQITCDLVVEHGPERPPGVGFIALWDRVSADHPDWRQASLSLDPGRVVLRWVPVAQEGDEDAHRNSARAHANQGGMGGTCACHEVDRTRA